jgi:hypothetical protein
MTKKPTSDAAKPASVPGVVLKRIVRPQGSKAANFWARINGHLCVFQKTIKLQKQLLHLRYLIWREDLFLFKLRSQNNCLRFCICLLWCVHKYNYVMWSNEPSSPTAAGDEVERKGGDHE